MRKKSGDMAPTFVSEALSGDSVDLSQLQGHKVMLSFYRYAACPLCNLRVHSLSEWAKGELAGDLTMIAVFQSPRESMMKYVGAQEAPFPLLSDPDHLLYKLYGVEARWGLLCKAFFTRARDFFRARGEGFGLGKMEGNIHQVPADFLIDEEGVIRVAYYGRDIGDHLPIAEIEAWLRKRV